MADLTRERLIGYGKARAKEGAGPVTLGIDIGYIRTVLVHAAAIHGYNRAVRAGDPSALRAPQAQARRQGQ